MSLPEFYKAVQEEANDSDIMMFMGDWEGCSPIEQEFAGLVYCMVANGAFDSVPRKNRATKRTKSKIP